MEQRFTNYYGEINAAQRRIAVRTQDTCDLVGFYNHHEDIRGDAFSVVLPYDACKADEKLYVLNEDTSIGQAIVSLRVCYLGDGNYQRCAIYFPGFEKAKGWESLPQEGVVLSKNYLELKDIITADDNVSIDKTFLLPVSVRVSRGVVVSASLVKRDGSPNHISFQGKDCVLSSKSETVTDAPVERKPQISDILPRPPVESDVSFRNRLIAYFRRWDLSAQLEVARVALGADLDVLGCSYGLQRRGTVAPNG